MMLEVGGKLQTNSMQLRSLTREDLRLYERIYTDPRMWAELAGVLDQDIPENFERAVASVEADRHWVFVIVTDDGTAVGTVSLWNHEWGARQSTRSGGWCSPNTRDAGSHAPESPRL